MSFLCLRETNISPSATTRIFSLLLSSKSDESPAKRQHQSPTIPTPTRVPSREGLLPRRVNIIHFDMCVDHGHPKQALQYWSPWKQSKYLHTARPKSCVLIGTAGGIRGVGSQKGYWNAGGKRQLTQVLHSEHREMKRCSSFFSPAQPVFFSQSRARQALGRGRKENTKERNLV